MSGQDVIKEMRQIGAGIETRLTDKFNKVGAGIETRLIDKFSKMGARIKNDLKKEIRALGVKIEAVDHKVDLLAENQAGMKKKLDATFETVGELSEDMVTIKDSVTLRRMVGSGKKMD